jgi:hypothetical protein
MTELHNYEVNFTVYLDEDKMKTNSSLTSLTTRIPAITSTQAQSIIEAQYMGRVRVFSVVRV